MNNAAILRISKLTSFAEVAAASGHMARTRPTPNADPERSGLNRVIIGSGDPAADVRKRIADSGVVVRKVGKNRSVLAIDVFLGASPELFEALDESGLQAWCDAGVAYLKKMYGPENVVSVILHMDETSPHLTAMVVPVDDTPTKAGKGPAVRLNAKRWLDGAAKLSGLQDEYAAAVAGFGLERGIRGSRARHKTVKQFYGELVAAETEAAQAKTLTAPTVPEPGTETLQEYQQNFQSELNRVVDEANAHIAEAAKTAAAAKVEAKTARERARAMECTARAAEMARVRDIPLADTMQHLGMEPDRQDPRQFRTPAGRISVDDAKWFNHSCGKGGGGSIDLAMHLLDCDFKTAVAFLGHRAGNQAAVGAYAAHSLAMAPQEVEKAKAEVKPYEAPRAAPEATESLKKYLWRCGVSPTLAQRLISRGQAYATRRHGFTNAVFTRPQAKAAEVVGINSDFKGLAPGSSRNDGPAFALQQYRGRAAQALVLVESAIDVISCRVSTRCSPSEES